MPALDTMRRSRMGRCSPSAAIIAVGSELLTPHRTDTNSLWLTERLEELGLDLRAKHVVGDKVKDVVAALEEALRRAKLVVLCGGLGPTEDDVTRDAVARVARRKLRIDAGVLHGIEARFRRFGIPMPENNRRQALMLQGAAVIDNPRGTAPGQLLRIGRSHALLLPGPPHEMKAVWGEAAPLVSKALAPRPARTVAVRKLLIAGMPESQVDAVAAPIYKKARGVSTTILCSPGQIELHLRAEGRTLRIATRRAEALAAALREVLGAHVFAEGDETLERVVVAALRVRSAKVALCESCTGGLIGHRLTQVPGASEVLDLGVVAYANWAKVELAGVREDTLAVHGAVSAEAAKEMAEGVRARARATYGLSVTGIAGPAGGSEEKPVGTTFLALASEVDTRVVKLQLPGAREQVKWQASQAALNLLRKVLAAPKAGG